MKNQVVICVGLLLLGQASFAQQAGWVGSWGAAPIPPREAFGPRPATPSFDNETIRQVMRLSVGGERLRLRLTNEYGPMPLDIGAAQIAILDSDGMPVSGTERVVTFGGNTSTTMPAGAPVLSDPIELAVDDLANLEVSLYLPGSTGQCTCHAIGLQDTYVSEPGDFTSVRFTPAATIQSKAFLSGVEVWTEVAGVVVTLGDSITDGFGSTPDANRRWPDLLAERLNSRSGEMRVGVVNQGVSGNRVLSDGAGESALARFDRDVLAVPGVTHLIVFEGINDLGVGFGGFEGVPRGRPVTVESMISGYRQLIARAHAHNIRIYAATIAPFEGAGYYTPEGEEVRQAINAWIRESGEFDAVLDFAAVWADADNPGQIAAGLHSGDFLHGSDAGYDALADSIDLSLF